MSAEPVRHRTPTMVPCLMTPGSLCHRAEMPLRVSGVRPQSPQVGGTTGSGIPARRQPQRLAGGLVLHHPPCRASA